MRSDVFGQFVVQRRQAAIGEHEVEPADDILFAEMVFLVDHDGILAAQPVHAFVLFIDQGGAARTVGGEIGTDKMIVAQRLRNIFGNFVHRIQIERMQADRLFGYDANDFLARGGRKPVREIIPRKVGAPTVRASTLPYFRYY